MYITLHDGVVVRLDEDADLITLFEAKNQREVLALLKRLPVVVAAPKRAA